MKAILTIGILALILINGCNIRTWNTEVRECSQGSQEGCDFERCLYQHSAGYSTSDVVQVMYYQCLLKECQND